jgi:hypothetical protein
MCNCGCLIVIDVKLSKMNIYSNSFLGSQVNSQTLGAQLLAVQVQCSLHTVVIEAQSKCYTL